MQLRIALLGTLVVLLLFGSSTAALAQDAAGVEQGLKPYGSFHGGDIDSISMVNLKLNLHIPLASFPQRGGKLHLGFYISYYNQTFNGSQECTPKPHIVCTESYTNYYAPVLDSMNQNTSVMIVPDVTHYWCGGTSGPQAICGIYEPDGVLHQLGQVAGTDTWRTLDATGFISYAGNTPSYALDRNGIRYQYSPTSGYRIEDPNGNFMTATMDSAQNPLIWTDTLGRSIPEPFNFEPGGPLPAGSTSNCPSGPLPIVGAYTWNLPAMNGGTMTYTICTVTLTLAQNIFCGSDCPAPGRTRTATQSIVLPNNTAWNFAYDNNGEDNLTKITFPTGGSISYTYGDFGLCIGGDPRAPSAAPHVASRTVDANDGTGPHTWTYSQTYGPPNAQGYTTTIQTTVTDPLGNVTVHTETALGGLCTFNETEVDRYNGGATGTPLEKTVTMYNFSPSPFIAAPSPFATVINVVPAKVTTTLDNGQTKQIVKTYDTGVPMINTGAGTNVLYGNVLTETESAYGTTSGSPGPVARKTTTNYLAFGNSSYLVNNMVSLPSSVVVADSGGTTRSNTTYGYDETGLGTSGISTQHDSAPPAGTARGNQTSVHRQLLTGSAVSTTNCSVPVSSGGFLVSNKTYFDTGMVNVSSDPCTHPTTFAYSSTYAGAYPTTVTNAKNQPTNFTYDFNSGHKASVTDPNSQKTSYSYDEMWRLTLVSYPDGGEETYAFNESPGVYPFSASHAIRIDSLHSVITTNLFDGLGRVSTSIRADAQGPISADTTYDADGRVYSVSNPYRNKNTDTTFGLTSTLYDALARPNQVTKPDGSLVKTAYCGSTTLVTDEAGHWRRSTTDALGRLIEVDEPNSTTATVNSNGCPGTGDPIWVTAYSYDTLNNLASVTQSGSHGRSFLFDSVSRLTSSTNPETGTTPVTYTYDADGNVVTKADARSITITYSYDAIHRLLGRTYSNSDPAVTYTYDQAGCLGQPACYNIGRRTSMMDAGGSESLSYDKMGRELAHQRVTNNITKNTSYSYNLDGSLLTLTYPSGRVITYTTDTAGRPSLAQDIPNSVNYVTGTCANGVGSNGVCYAPQGGVAQFQNGTNLVSTFIYNRRLQPCWIYATTGSALAASTSCTATDTTPGTILDLKYNFNVGAGDNGNVMGITNNRDTTRSQTFTYDQVSRIATGATVASCGANCWGLTFGYDQWANLTTAAATGSATPLNLAINASNRITTAGFSYDATGNLTADLTSAYVWNAESEIKTGGGVTYTYDGDGNRIQKSNGKIYWYGAGTEILNESDAAGNFTDEYVFFGGKRVAHRSVSSGTIYYYAEDMLGSSRALVQAGQTSVCYDADFYPYGGEKPSTNTCAQNYKFEGKERDTETSNDDFGARYYSSVYGRWLSPDWSAIPAPVPYANLNNPQTLNLYSIVADDPETFDDLDGHACDGQQGTPGGTPCNAHQDSSQYIGNAAGYYNALVSGTVSGQSQTSSNTNSTSNNSNGQQNSGNASDQKTGQSPQGQQPDTTKQPSWDPKQPFPDDPAKLGPDWKPDTEHDPKNKSGDKRYVNDKTGDKVDWHKGDPDAKKGTWERIDHWHWVPGGTKQERHYTPGDTIRKVGVAGWVATLIYLLSEAAQGFEF